MGTQLAFSQINGAAISVKDKGAAGDGVTDDTAAFQAALDDSTALLAVYIPAGNYLITSTLTVDLSRLIIRGEAGASQIKFEPTADDILFDVFQAGGASSATQITFENLILYSVDTTYAKTAFRLSDASQCEFNNVQSKSPHWYGGAAGSIGLNIRARDVSSVTGFRFFADRPIYIEQDPDSSIIGIDNFNFHNLYLGTKSGSTFPLIEIADDVVLTQISFTGHQSWTGGAGGLKWVDTTGSATCNGLYLNNVRWEQTDDVTKYFLNIDHSSTVLQNLVINGGQTGGSNGLYLRGVQYVSINDFWYTESSSSRTAINANATLLRLTTSNTFWQTGPTATLTGIGLIWALENITSGAIVQDGVYVVDSTETHQITNNATLSSSGISLADTAKTDLGDASQLGHIFIAMNAGFCATFILKGSGAAVAELEDPDSVYTPTKDNAGTINVYWDSGTSRYVLQNNRGVTNTFYFQRMGKS